MIFIDKTTIHSNESRNRLEILKTGFRHKGKTLEKLYGVANQSGGKLWKLGLDKSVLRQDLHKEQGGICCYCCQKLSFQIDNNKFDHHTKIEHFLIKSASDVDKSQEKQAFRERLYNYDNLMLACAGGETYEIKTKNRYGRLDTKNDVAELLGVSVETLDELNPNATYTAGKHIKYVENKQQYCDTKRNEGTFRIFNNNKYPDFKALLEKRKKETPQYLPREKDIIPIVNPSVSTDCWKYFDVRPDGTMTVNKSLSDNALRQVVENTLIVLNLNEETLKNSRKKAFDAFSKAIDRNFNALGISLEDYLTLQLVRVKTPFCFVNYLVILNRIGNFP